MIIWQLLSGVAGLILGVLFLLGFGFISAHTGGGVKGRTKLWSFDKVMSSSCPSGTVYEKHSLIKLYMRRFPLFKKSYFWKCNRCEDEWRTDHDQV